MANISPTVGWLTSVRDSGGADGRSGGIQLTQRLSRPFFSPFLVLVRIDRGIFLRFRGALRVSCKITTPPYDRVTVG